MSDKHNIPKGKMYSRLLPNHMVCKITQRNNMRRANTCDPALKLLDEEITSDILKHKQNLEGTLRCTLGSQTQHTHFHNISIQAHKPLQMIKALTTTGWGTQKETLMATCKAVMRRLWSMPFPCRLLHLRPALTNCKSCKM